VLVDLSLKLWLQNKNKIGTLTLQKNKKKQQLKKGVNRR